MPQKLIDFQYSLQRKKDILQHKIFFSLPADIKRKMLYRQEAFLSSDETNRSLSENLKSGKPFMASRLGSTELLTISYFHAKNRDKNLHFPTTIKQTICKYSGVFPDDNKTVAAFCEKYLSDIKMGDLYGVWYNPHEDNILKSYATNITYCPLSAIEPYNHDNPWSQYLAGKKVLVVHPFSKTIVEQYKKREKLFKDTRTLPDFDLKIVRSVQSLAYNWPEEFSNWFDALNQMTSEIGTQDFDVALVGAGAYGLPISAFIKRDIGKQAIHLAGALQILFGIRGARWDNHPAISNLYNENWIRPLQDDQMKRQNEIEAGCYW